MKMILLFLVVAVSMAMTSALNLYMAKGAKGTASKSVNMPRKLKRSLRNADKGTFESLVNKPETESFIKQLPDGLLYDNLMKMITKKRRELKIKVKTDYAVKPKVVLPDIVDTAVAAGTFGTLVKAVTAAGLGSVLKGTGPFTVFAPTDEAFAKLPEGTLDGLLADKEKLKEVLTYHVVPTYLVANKIIKDEKKVFGTVSGKDITCKVAKGENPTVTVDAATIVKADIKASNGYIHVIDAVLIPK